METRKYTYTAEVTAAGRGCMWMCGTASRELALENSERYASHVFAHRNEGEVPSLALLITRECAACGGTSRVAGPKGRTKLCVACRGNSVVEFISMRVVTRATGLVPCDGACCGGEAYVHCAACGYAHWDKRACGNPACRASAAAVSS